MMRASRRAGLRAVGDCGGVSRRMAEASSAEEVPSNGRRPVAISWRMMPREKMSVRWSSGRPEDLFGRHVGRRSHDDAWLVWPAEVSVASLELSAANIFRETEIQYFDAALVGNHDVGGLQVAMDDAFFVCGGERVGQGAGDLDDLLDGKAARGIRRSSDCPSTSSMVRKWTPSDSSTEKMVTMCGWLSAAMARASRWKRARRSGSRATSGGRTLSATSRPSLVSVARYTSPMPPAPMAAVTR